MGVIADRIFENEFIRQGILFGNEISAPLWFPPEEPMDVPSILRDLLAGPGMNQAKLAKKVGVGQGTISKWQNRQQSPNKKQWDAVMALIGHNPHAVGVKGLVGAGGTIDTGAEQIPPDGDLYEVEVYFPLPPDAFALQVAGDSMLPRYDSGDVIVCQRAMEPALLLGCEVVVQTDEGSRYLKRLFEGSRKGRYDLISFNAPPIRGVRLQWVASVIHVARSGQWRKVERQGRRRSKNA